MVTRSENCEGLFHDLAPEITKHSFLSGPRVAAMPPHGPAVPGSPGIYTHPQILQCSREAGFGLEDDRDHRLRFWLQGWTAWNWESAPRFQGSRRRFLFLGIWESNGELWRREKWHSGRGQSANICSENQSFQRVASYRCFVPDEQMACAPPFALLSKPRGFAHRPDITRSPARDTVQYLSSKKDCRSGFRVGRGTMHPVLSSTPEQQIEK